jgi:hypothetical protein
MEGMKERGRAAGGELKYRWAKSQITWGTYRSRWSGARDTRRQGWGCLRSYPFTVSWYLKKKEASGLVCRGSELTLHYYDE